MTSLVPTASLFGLPISRLDTAATVELLARAAARDLGRDERRPFLATYVNPHTINQTREDRALVDALRRFDLLYPDGIGLVWAARFLREPLPERVTASDFLPDFCRAAATRRLAVYLLGGEPGVARAAAERLERAAPGLDVVGARPGFFSSQADSAAAIEEIRAARPAACLVAMGSPLQERWILAHAAELQVPLVWAIGGALDFHSGRKRRAPRWMMRLGIEWAYRMALEPRRLWRRYLIGNARFASQTIAEKCRSL